MTKNLLGKTISFKLITLLDADFVCELRTNEKINQHLSAVSGNVNDQINWIKSYKTREESNKEFYFIISRRDNNNRIGTVRLYDFIETEKSFSWGSWILNSNKTTSSAIESALLVYKFAFEELKFQRSHFEVRKDNIKVSAFHEKLGAKIVSEDSDYYYYEFHRETYVNKISKFSKYLAD